MIIAWGNFFGVPLDVVLSNEQMTPQKAAEIVAGGIPTSEAKLIQFAAAKAYLSLSKYQSTEIVSGKEDLLAKHVKENVIASQKANKSSNFGKFSKAEGTVQESLGIWPPNRGAYGPVEKITLPNGAIIDRYGSTKGTFTSLVGVPFENRALPSYSANAPYNVYKVLKPIDGVSKSKILPWFGQKGQGTQYELPKPVQWYLDNHYLGENK